MQRQPISLPPQLQRTCRQALVVAALLLVSLLGSSSQPTFPVAPTAETSLVRSLPVTDESTPDNLLNESGERLLRAVDRWLRTLAQNRTVCGSPSPQQYWQPRA